MSRHPRHLWAILFCAVVVVTRLALADSYDPPASYYNSATGTGATLKQQLHDIIAPHSGFSYDAARSILQITDADPNNPGHILLIYDRVSLDVASINPGGPIPGWDGGDSWNREHTWPLSRGLGSDAMPDGSDLHNLRPATPSVNSNRGNLNFGGAYGAQPFGIVSDGGNNAWYPGNADAGMVARQMFYMAVRYDGTQSGTTNLELAPGNPDIGDTLLGNLNRLVEWHFAAPPDDFERRRNQIVFDSYQQNRIPFVDRPEFVWSVFINQANNSRISLAGTTVNADGSSLREIDLGRVYVGAPLPAAQPLTLNKTGNDGTYFQVTTSGNATSSLSGRLNAFRTGMVDSKPITVGLDTTTATSGNKSGAVTIDNLDVTTGGGAGRGANDANDVIAVSLAVLDHPIASWEADVELRNKTIDFGIVPLNGGAVASAATIISLAPGAGPTFAADLDLDSIQGTGDVSDFDLDLSLFLGLAQGGLVQFSPLFSPTTIGQLSAEYTLFLSGEDLPGEQTQILSFSLVGEAILAGDYNRNGVVDAADYVLWRRMVNQSVAAYEAADGNGDTTIDQQDYLVWRAHFGDVAPGGGAGALGSPSPVPEPHGLWLWVHALATVWIVSGIRARKDH